MPRLLKAETTVAVLLGASDWTSAGMERAPSYKRSASAIHRWLVDSRGFGMNPERLIDLFDTKQSAGDQLDQLADRFRELVVEAGEEGPPIEDVILFYVGHGILDGSGSLILLVRRSSKGREEQTGLRVTDLATTLKLSLPRQRQYVVLDCCFSEAAAKSFIGMGAREQAVAASAVKDLEADVPRRGGLLLCACAANEIAIGTPQSQSTLFSGAMMDVLRNGDPQLPEEFSFRDLTKAIRDRLIELQGADAPKPVLHPVNQRAGDLTGLAAFTNPRAEQEVREQEARERAEREAAAKAAREQAELEAAEKAAREQAQREATEKAAREQTEREAAEKAAREQAEREAAEKERREQSEREAADKMARELAEREATEKAAREKAERETAEKTAREQAERETTDQASREPAEREAAEETRSEQAEPEAATKAARQAELRDAIDQAIRDKAAHEEAREAELDNEWPIRASMMIARYVADGRLPQITAEEMRHAVRNYRNPRMRSQVDLLEELVAERMTLEEFVCHWEDLPRHAVSEARRVASIVIKSSADDVRQFRRILTIMGIVVGGLFLMVFLTANPVDEVEYLNNAAEGNAGELGNVVDAAPADAQSAYAQEVGRLAGEGPLVALEQSGVLYRIMTAGRDEQLDPEKEYMVHVSITTDDGRVLRNSPARMRPRNFPGQEYEAFSISRIHRCIRFWADRAEGWQWAFEGSEDLALEQILQIDFVVLYPVDELPDPATREPNCSAM